MMASMYIANCDYLFHDAACEGSKYHSHLKLVLLDDLVFIFYKLLHIPWTAHVSPT